MRFPSSSVILTLFYLSASQAADSKSPKAHLPCTVTSPSGSFYDLNPIAVQPLVDGKKAHKDDREESWKAKGYDYGSDFKLNICAPVIEELENVVGVDEKLWRNVSAYYTKGKKTYSIGYVVHDQLSYINGYGHFGHYTNRYVQANLNYFVDKYPPLLFSADANSF